MRLTRILAHSRQLSGSNCDLEHVRSVSQTYNCTGQHLTPHCHVCIPHLPEAHRRQGIHDYTILCCSEFD